jgi:hypothetical protein
MATRWIWPDLRQWFKAIFRHWKSLAGGSGASVILLIASIWAGGYWLAVLGLVTLFVSFFPATFLAWRDEHRKTIGKERRLILNKVVELSSSGNTDILGALIKVSDEFGSEEDVEWVCQQLDDQDDYDPFLVICEAAGFEPGFDGKRLKFLQDARVARIGSLDQAIQYSLSTWFSKNGFTTPDQAGESHA